MGFRFRRRLKLFPGIWLNVSKSGVSTSVGGHGLTVNLKDGKTRTTVGLPGTGVSYSSTATSRPTATAISNSTPSASASAPKTRPLFWIILALILLAGAVYAVNFQ